MSRLGSFKGSAVNVSDWFLYYTNDLIVDLAFGRDLGLKSGLGDRRHFELLNIGTNVLGLVTPVPWLAHLLFSLPGVASLWKRLGRWCGGLMEERLSQDLNKREASYWIVNAVKAEKEGDASLDLNAVYGDAIAIMLAGG